MGCGKGGLIKSIVKRDDFKLLKTYLVGIDIYRPYLEVAKKIYHDVVVGDVRFLPFRIKSVDVIIVTELIEHLSKSDAYNLIKDIEVIAKKQLQLITPVGDNSKYHLEDNNPWQAHLSKWLPEEFGIF